jgi:hypothetical protein
MVHDHSGGDAGGDDEQSREHDALSLCSRPTVERNETLQFEKSLWIWID